jgi:hypothetical protein
MEGDPMDDFLHNLRSGKLKHPDRGRRDYTDYKGPQRRVGNERRRTDYYAKVTTENFALIKETLDALADYQKRIADTMAARERTEARIADALETIAATMGNRRLEDGLSKARRKNHPETDEEITNRKTPTASAASQPIASTLRNKLSTKDKPELLKLIAAMRNDGHSWEKIARDFDDRDIATVSGKGKWRGPAIKKFWEANS